jgi:hypothetical protein
MEKNLVERLIADGATNYFAAVIIFQNKIKEEINALSGAGQKAKRKNTRAFGADHEWKDKYGCANYLFCFDTRKKRGKGRGTRLDNRARTS